MKQTHSGSNATAQIIGKHKETIIDNWLADLAEEMPFVELHEDSAIINSIPGLIDAMVGALKERQPKEVIFHSQKHGLIRAKFKEYSLGHIIREYNLLRKKIFTILDEAGTVALEDRNLVIYIIDQAIEQASETYHRIKQQVLIDARKMAEQKAHDLELTDENREAFIQSISHDLNGPLNNVSACVELLESGVSVEKAEKIMGYIRTSLNQAEGLIKDFLDVSTLDSQKELPVSLVKAGVLEDLRKEITVYQVSQSREVEIESNEEDIYAFVDIDLLRRAFGNLMSNAIKHSTPSSKITVSCNKQDDELHISVHNKGKEIPQEKLDSIFQADDSAKGWGIGLAFVKKVAEAHGGRVKASSQGEDITFTMIFPVDKE